MQDIEFLKYQPTPEEKYLGVASVRYLQRIVLRYKIVMKKDGKGYFAVPAAYKVDEDTFISAFMIDSRAEEEEIISVVRAGIKPFVQEQLDAQHSAFSPSDNEEIPF